MTGNGGRLRRAANDWKWWAGFLAVIFGLYQAAPAIGLELPRWTWRGEFKHRMGVVDKRFDGIDSKFADVATEQIKASREQLRTRRDVLRGQLWQVEKEIRELQRADKPVPESLYRERARLMDSLQGVRNKLVPSGGPVP